MKRILFLIAFVSAPCFAATPAEVVDFALRQSTMSIPVLTVTENMTVVYSTTPTTEQRQTADAIVRNTDTSDDALAAFDATLAALGTDTVFLNSRPIQQIVGAAVFVLIDEINALRQRDVDRSADVAAATTLADLKTRWAARAALSQRTAAQARAAVRAKLDSGASR